MNRIPNRLYLDVTSLCNQRCLHCSVEAGEESPGLLSLEEIFDVLHQARTIGIGKVVFSGGEPLARKGIFEILEHCRGLGMEVTVLTNGSLINSAAVDFFKAQVIHIKISLDGASEETHDYLRGKGAFSHLMKVLKLLERLPDHLKSLHFTIHRKNIQELLVIPELLEKVKIRNLMIGTIKPSGRAALNRELILPPQMTPYVRQMIQKVKSDPRICVQEFASKGWEGFGCPAVCDKFGLSADGRATTCVFLGKDYLQKSIRETSLENLWSQYLGAENLFKVNDTCAACSWLEKTGGGCRARAKYFYGDINAPDPTCCAMKDFQSSMASLV